MHTERPDLTLAPALVDDSSDGEKTTALHVVYAPRGGSVVVPSPQVRYDWTTDPGTGNMSQCRNTENRT